MFGTIVNASAIIAGSLLGLFLRGSLKENYKTIVIQAMSLSVIIIGIMGAIKMDNPLVILGSMVIGCILGEMIDIESKLEGIGDNLKKRLNRDDSKFTEGFLTASLVYTIGAMAVIGAIESGLLGKHDTLFAKSILDGMTSIIFASSFGVGVLFSALPVFLYQGSITLLAGMFKDVLTPLVVTQMSSVGGILIMGIGLNMLGISDNKIKVGNMLPAIVFPIIYYAFFS